MAGSTIPADGHEWNTTVPDGNQPHGNDYNEHRQTKLAIDNRIKKEHVAFADYSSSNYVGGEHKAGSAVIYFGDYSSSSKGDSLPTNKPDGATALDSADYGRLAYDTDATYGGVMYIYTAAGWVEFIDHRIAVAWAKWTQTGGTYTLVSSYNVTSITDNGTGDISLNFTKAMATSNYAAIVTPKMPEATTTPLIAFCPAQNQSAVQFYFMTPAGVKTDCDGFMVVFE